MNLRIPDDLGRLGYGAAHLGNLYSEISDDQAQQIVDAAWDGGIRYFDTAPHYGLGLAERRLGAALAERPRAEFLVSTKVGRLLRPTPERADRMDDGFVVPAAYERVWDPSLDGIRRSLADSRDRLGLDEIDIAFLHDPDEYDLASGIATGLPALAEVRAAGEVQAIGVGSKSVAALTAAVRTGLCDVVMVAGRLTLLDDSGRSLLPLCREYGVGIVNVGVFNSGALAAPRPGPELTFEYAPIPADRLAQLERIHEACERHGVAVLDAALQYAGQLPGVVNVTVGAATAKQISRSVAGMAAPVPDGLWADLAMSP